MSDRDTPVRATRGRPARATKATKAAVKTPVKKTPAKRGKKKAEENEVLISDEENGHQEKTEDVEMAEEANAESASEDKLLESGDEAEGEKTNEEEHLILNDSNIEGPIEDEPNVEENGINEEPTEDQRQPAKKVDKKTVKSKNGAETVEEETENTEDANEKADDEESSEVISDKEESTEVIADEEESTEVIADEMESSEVIDEKDESTEIASENAEITETENLESTEETKSTENGVAEMEVDEVTEEPVVSTEDKLDAAKKTKTVPENGDPEAENISDDELPGVKVAKVPEAEEVSDEELPGPKRAELPADTEDVSGDELPATKKDDEKESPKKANKKRKASHGDASSSASETPAKKAALDKDEKDAKAEVAKPKKLPELDKYWKAVNDDPSDFTGWTYLLQYVDQENDMEAAREAYDAFLSHYPYCYGYWRKYADYEKRKGNKKKCEEVFERGLKAIPLSVDLWLHYLTYVKQTRADEEEFVRSQFERAVSACGLEFRSDRLWDGFIKWETEGKRLQKVTALYDRLLATPTQGYTTHFDNFQEHVSSNMPNKILDTDEFLAIRKDVRQILKAEAKDGEEPPPAEESDAPPGDEDTAVSATSSDEETKGIKEKIVSIRRKVHKANGQAVTSRWSFEEGIKRPYFHVKPLERCQLKNWQDYLDFEIEQGDKTRVIVLFERCLIACALYEDFWLKFVRFLENLKEPEMLQKVRDVYERACTIHHLKKPNLHMQWAIFEEASGNQNRAAEILVNLEKQVPNVLQVAYRRINLERRRGDFEKCQQLFEHYIGNSKNKMISSNIAIKYSRFSLKILKDAAKAQEVLKTAIAKDANNPRLYLQLIDLVLQKESVTEEEVCAIIDEFLEKETVEPEQKTLFAQRKLEFLEDFGKTVQSVQAAQEQYKTFQKLSKDIKKKDVKRQPLGPLHDNNSETTQEKFDLYHSDEEDTLLLEDDLFLESLGIQTQIQKLTTVENRENQKYMRLEKEKSSEKSNEHLRKNLESQSNTLLSDKQKRKLERRKAKELKRLKEKKNKEIGNMQQSCEIVPEIIEIKQEPLVESIDIDVPDLEIPFDMAQGTDISEPLLLPDVKVEQLVDGIDDIVLDVKVEELVSLKEEIIEIENKENEQRGQEDQSLDVKIEELVSLKEEIVEMENNNQEQDEQMDVIINPECASDMFFRKKRKKGREKQEIVVVENERRKEITKLEKIKLKEKTIHIAEKETWRDRLKRMKVERDDLAAQPSSSLGNALLKRIGAFQQFQNESKERRAAVKKHVEPRIIKSSGELSSLDSSVEIIDSRTQKHKKHKKKSKKRKHKSTSDDSVVIIEDPIPKPHKSHHKSHKRKTRDHSANDSKNWDEYSNISSNFDNITSLDYPETEASHQMHHKYFIDQTLQHRHSIENETGILRSDSRDRYIMDAKTRSLGYSMDDQEILRKYYDRLHSNSPDGVDSRYSIDFDEVETRRYVMEAKTRSVSFSMDDQEILRKYYDRLRSNSPGGVDFRYPIDFEQEILRKYYDRQRSNSPHGVDSRYSIDFEEVETRRLRYSMEGERVRGGSSGRLGSRHHQYLKEEEIRRLAIEERNNERNRVRSISTDRWRIHSSSKDRFDAKHHKLSLHNVTRNERHKVRNNSRDSLSCPRSSREVERDRLRSNSKERLRLRNPICSKEEESRRHRYSMKDEQGRRRINSKDRLKSTHHKNFKEKDPLHIKEKTNVQFLRESKILNRKPEYLQNKISKKPEQAQAEKLKKVTGKVVPGKKTNNKPIKKVALNTNKKETVTVSAGVTAEQAPKKKPKRIPKKKKKKQEAATTLGLEIKQEPLELSIKKKKKKRSGADQKRRWRRRQVLKARMKKEELEKAQIKMDDVKEETQCCDDVASLKKDN